MTLNEIAYNVLNLVRGGRSNHDEHISLDQIKFNIKHYRAMLIRRDFARNGIVTRHLEEKQMLANVVIFQLVVLFIRQLKKFLKQ